MQYKENIGLGAVM